MIIDLSKPLPKGADAADFLESGITWEQFRDWAKPRANVFVAIQQNLNVNVNVESEDNGDPDGSAIATWDDLGIAKTKAGNPIVNAGNAFRVLSRLPKFKDFVWYDEFHQKYFTNKDGAVREWRDTDTIDLMFFMQEKIGIQRMSDEMVMKAVIQYAQARKRNEPKDWIQSLKWDGVERLPTFFVDCFEADDTEYARAVGSNFWIGLIARIFRPGCQLDNMVVLEGAQGIRKTSALRAIGGKWFTDIKYSIDNPNFLQCLQGKFIVEVAEMDAFGKADVTRIKQILSSTVDRYRAPYARAPEDFPRQSIFVGTTNEDHWQRDNTGGRRFWPIRCGTIAFDTLQANREQYFAEALAKFSAGAEWWHMPDEETKHQQELRRQADEWESIISQFLYGKNEVSVSEIATEALGIDVGKLDMLVQRRIGQVLRALKWEKTQVMKMDGVRKVWRPANPKKTLIEGDA